MKRRKQKEEQEVQPESTEIDLANKYRPKNLDEIYGNALLKKALKTMVQESAIPHAVMLSGPAGCGKTSLARILASCLGCSDFDCKEINIADFTGVDLIRDIIRKANTSPMKGSVKVFIMDEFHKSTDAAQNALLKILEEPPKHVYFFLCSTDPQKIISTIKSRCTQYQVQTLSEKQIFGLVSDVAQKEGFEVPKKVALQIARDSLGHARNALKILSKIRYLDEEGMLGAALQEAEKVEQSIALCRAIMNKRSWKEIAEILRSLKDEPESVRRHIRSYFNTILLNGNESAFVVLDIFNTNYFNTDGKVSLTRDCYEAYKEFE